MLTDQAERLQRFVAYAEKLKGDEKGEAQVFCDRLFQAFGHEGYKEAGATLEDRQYRRGKNVKFIDLIWKPRLILEMKSRTEDLRDHYQQAFEYWLHCVPHRPKYVVLCNFDEFWIYEFDEQMEEPMDRVRLADLPKRYDALNFLLPTEKKPRFGNNRVAVTRSAADKLAVVFNSIMRRTKDRARSQRFILQCLVAMVSEDVGLLPNGILLELLEECDSAAKSYDLIGNLFKQMNTDHSAQGGRYKNVPYFNGGLFQEIDPIELTSGEVLLLIHAAGEDWGKVQPAVFGSLFQSSMDQKERHAHGAHFTNEADIQKVVLPTIIRPFRARLDNPPFQSKNKMQKELGPVYLQKLRGAYPDIPGRADYCVYWFRKAHDSLQVGQRAGLVGTNTIRQNYSREGGLDHIVQNNGTITEAVSSQPWSGDAAVHVSIVNWIKGQDSGNKYLFELTGNDRQGPWKTAELPFINSSLSFTTDVSTAKRLKTNSDSKACFQGQTHGHEGFLLTPKQAIKMYEQDAKNHDVIFSFLTANDMLSTFPPSPKRYVIDFHPRDLIASSKYSIPFAIVKKEVLPSRQKAADEEEKRNQETLREDPKARVNVHHANFLKQWWLLSWARGEMIQAIAPLSRYIACGQVTKRPIFEFVSPDIHPNAACMVFPFEDDYSFGILQSAIHWSWFVAKCSTLTERFRYTSDTVFDTFPWPQSPTSTEVARVADASRALRIARRKSMDNANLSLRELYQLSELPGENAIKTAHANLDAAVRLVYGMSAKGDPLSFLLALNSEVALLEDKGITVQAPGVPSGITNADSLVSKDRMEIQPLALSK